MNFEITKAIADGDAVVIAWIIAGTNTGKIAGYPPTNKSIRALDDHLSFQGWKDLRAYAGL